MREILSLQFSQWRPPGALDCRYEAAWSCNPTTPDTVQALASLANQLRLLRPELVLIVRHDGQRLEVSAEPARQP